MVPGASHSAARLRPMGLCIIQSSQRHPSPQAGFTRQCLSDIGIHVGYIAPLRGIKIDDSQISLRSGTAFGMPLRQPARTMVLLSAHLASRSMPLMALASSRLSPPSAVPTSEFIFQSKIAYSYSP